ncbi:MULTISPECIES: GNAT family N-acetyltransferase [unclassified Streptomyces]|uniref:GNAT family N-acetyltransferase n=1 Tax=unclassified Streptomyces TaxID=2593676 RepID=UPI002E29D1B7|nr:GNAT family N-acetyltransferase [Streptomyces sp. NBC_00223]
MAFMPTSEVTIRQATLADEGALADLNRAAWSWLSEVKPRPDPGEAFFSESLPPRQVLVAERDGVVVGFIRQVPPTRLASNQHVRQIQGLAVDPAVRGAGIGRALVEAACAAAREEGARRMTLRVLGHNAPARRLYESCGFAVEGVCEEEFWIDGSYVDDVLMARRLTA